MDHAKSTLVIFPIEIERVKKYVDFPTLHFRSPLNIRLIGCWSRNFFRNERERMEVWTRLRKLESSLKFYKIFLGISLSIVSFQTLKTCLYVNFMTFNYKIHSNIFIPGSFRSIICRMQEMHNQLLFNINHPPGIVIYHPVFI